MSIWQNNSITPIYTGSKPNDGSGDSIYAAFTKVDTNFANLSVFLNGTAGPTDFNNANVYITLNAPNWANINNANITTVYGSQANNGGDISVGGSFVPIADGLYNLGSPTRQFKTIYFQNQVQSGTTTTVDAGLLKIHANAFPGDIQDTGIFGNISSDFTNTRTYAFFGHQYTTNDFVYKFINNDATLGNNIVAGGIYGNVHFGSAFLSNSSSTPGGNTLIVSGNTSISGNTFITGNTNINGNLYTGGNIYSNGSLVITTGLINTFGTPSYAGGTIVGSQYFTGNINTTGSLNITGGLIKTDGNIYAPGFVGPYYGTIQTANQPNITGVGQLGNLTIATGGTLNTPSIISSSISSTNITASGNVYVSQIIGLTSLGVTGNITAGGFVGPHYGAVMTANQSNITVVGTLISLAVTGNVTAGNVTATQLNGNVQGTLLTANQPNITNVGTLGTLAVTNGITASTLTGTLTTTSSSQPNVTSLGTLTGLNISGNTASTNTLYARGIYDNGVRVVSTSTGAGNLTTSSSAGTINLTTHGPGAITIGSASAVPVVTTDVYGRITALTTTPIPTGANISGNVGTGTIAFATQTLNIDGGVDITTSVSNQTVIVNDTSTLATVTGRGATTSTAVTFNGQSTFNSQLNIGASLIPSANVSYNLGSSSSWFNTYYGVSTHAQYADLAENYQADAAYPAGTVIVFGGSAEVTTTTEFADARVAGAVSTDPAHLMNGGLTGPNVVALALRGRVPVNVVGPVTKGDSLVTCGARPGYAVSVGTTTTYGQAVFAKALETNSSEGEKVITAVIL